MAVEMSIQEYIRERSDRDGFETAMFIYQSALTQMGSRIEVLNSELNHMHSYNPIEYVKSRLKTPESIMKKLRKNGHNLNIEDMIEYVNDIAGIRITCSFFSEIYFVADMIARQDNLEVISIKDYISQPKESGYKSYHMLLSIPVALGDAKVPTKVELQIRTMAMDFWASLEHKIYYKYEGNAPHSRHTEVPIEDIHNCKELTVLAESDEAGLFLAMADGGRKIFVMGHPEYDRVTLDGEYKRDVSKNLPIEIPENYYKDNNPENRPLLMWRAHANNLYTNWLNYYVYQSTPFDLYGTPDFSEI